MQDADSNSQGQRLYNPGKHVPCRSHATDTLSPPSTCMGQIS